MIKTVFVKFNALKKRERLLIALACITLVAVVSFISMIEPLMKNLSIIEANIQHNERTISTRQIEINAVTQALSMDSSEPVRRKIAELEKKDTHISNVLQQRSMYLMDPITMGQVLETVLSDKPGIILQRLSSLPVKPLNLSLGVEPVIEEQLVEESLKTTSPSLELSAAIYSHGFEVQLHGGYADIYEYLRKLEGLSTAFFWDSLEYSVSEYPNSEVILRIHTLSAVEGWIGG